MLYPWTRTKNGATMVYAIELDPIYLIKDQEAIPFAYWMMGERAFFEHIAKWISEFSLAHPTYGVEPNYPLRKIFLTRTGFKVEGMIPACVLDSWTFLEKKIREFYEEMPDIREGMNTISTI